jgi:hypothetical protein
MLSVHTPIPPDKIVLVDVFGKVGFGVLKVDEEQNTILIVNFPFQQTRKYPEHAAIKWQVIPDPSKGIRKARYGD